MLQSRKPVANLDKQSTNALNLTVLQRADAFVEEILLTATHVAVYAFNVELSQWVRPSALWILLSPLFLCVFFCKFCLVICRLISDWFFFPFISEPKGGWGITVRCKEVRCLPYFLMIRLPMDIGSFESKSSADSFSYLSIGIGAGFRIPLLFPVLRNWFLFDLFLLLLVLIPETFGFQEYTT